MCAATPCAVGLPQTVGNVRHRTDLVRRVAYNVTNTFPFLTYQEMTMQSRESIKQLAALACGTAVLLLAGCASEQKAPATADVAVSRNAVQNAVAAGAPELAPEEITNARQKMLMANQALAAKDYKRARQLAMEAQADAQLAQSKATSAKATAASNALNADLRALRDEVERANAQ
jgi:uncharacterized protein YcfL